jgi:hypothetical protein
MFRYGRPIFPALVLGVSVALGQTPRSDALVAKRVKVVLDSLPTPWVATDNVMDEIWAPVKRFIGRLEAR